MKKLFLFLAVASTTMFVSCSDDDSKKDGGEPAATSIVLAANVTSVEVGQPVVFTVTDNNAKVVTSTSTILVNNVEITGATFTATEAGTYAIKATHKNSKDVVLESNTVTVTVTAPVTTAGKFTYQGVDYALDNMGFAVHGSGGNITVLNFAEEGQPEEYASLWVGYAYSGDDAQTSLNYYSYYFTLPATVVDGTVTEVKFPGEAEATFLDLTVYINDAQNPTDVSVDGGSLTFTTFDLGETANDPMFSKNSSALTSGGTAVISHSYDGELASVSTANLLGSAKGAKTTSKGAFKSLSSKKMTMAQLKKLNVVLKK
ncbi:hypothetical protein [Flavobacterium sp.]|uniref:hypothetical protein n=1 Tax=Flavobacterium sp. TaxID=239 RepID=UPI0026238443|nr:hypothetical protein [Flavobacterium sp.]MDD3003861.1 hypothetical protein [Flavobacterium sp.]